MRGELAGASVWMGQGEELVLSVIRLRCDSGAACVPERVSRWRLEPGVHAAHSWDSGGERSRS